MDSDRTTLTPGTVVGRHKILSLLGTSSLGDAYLAEQVFLGRRVVLEKLAPAEPGFVKDMLRTARQLTSLDHPNIPSLHDADLHDGLPYLTWEYTSGWDLQQLVKTRGTLQLAIALRVVASIAGAAHHVHGRGIVHGGIGPRSILLAPSGVALLTGLWLQTPGSFAMAATPYDGRELLAYRSPEQARVEAAMPATDVWALGATLFFLLTGMPPYRHASDWELLQAIGSAEPADLRPLDTVAPEYARDIVARCLQKSPPNRYASCDDLRRALDAAVEHADMAGDETIELPPPQKGQALLLHVECEETSRPGQYREFEIGSRIGSGTFGELFRAVDTYTREVCALKMLRREWCSRKHVVERFRREARLLARISHPNVVTLRNYGRYGGTFLIAMDFLEGQTLRKVLADRGTLQPHEAASIAGQILAGLGAVHAAGGVHRDLKPANVMLIDGRAVVFDFGLAHMADMSELTLSGEFLGTPTYASPEQATNEPLTSAADIYAVGVMLYHMLTGELPHHGANALALLNSIATEPPLPIISHRDDLPPSLVAAVDAMLARSPDDRPNAAAARQLLTRF